MAFQTDWSLSVYVDGEVKAFMTGVPALPSDALFQVHVWNDEAWIPQIMDAFNPPNTAAYIKDIQ